MLHIITIHLIISCIGLSVSHKLTIHYNLLHHTLDPHGSCLSYYHYYTLLSRVVPTTDTTMLADTFNDTHFLAGTDTDTNGRYFADTDIFFLF